MAVYFSANLKIQTVVELLYLYSYEMATYKNIRRECRMADAAICNWRNDVRDIYSNYTLDHPLQIGGPGRVVEIDGRKTQWVFGGVDVESKEGFLV